MGLKVLYFSFFIFFDLILFYLLTKKNVLEKKGFKIVGVFFCLSLLNLFVVSLIVKVEIPSHLIFLSVAIVMLHFGFKAMFYFFYRMADKRLSDLFRSKLQPIVDFLRLKLIYFFVITYQFFYIFFR